MVRTSRILKRPAREDGDHYIVNGHKNYVTGAIYNELYAVFVRFDDIPGAKGIGAVIIERGDGRPDA
jgi:butyryl-CoA dehydrogenase